MLWAGWQAVRLQAGLRLGALAAAASALTPAGRCLLDPDGHDGITWLLHALALHCAAVITQTSASPSPLPHTSQERRAIKAAFPQREAYGLPRPALRTANLQRQKLNPEFHLVSRRGCPARCV